jgi:hypothetical protein
MTPDAVARTLDALASLPDGWEGGGAPVPSPASIHLARHAAAALRAVGLAPDEVDADAEGGVALTLFADTSSRAVWVAIPNTGTARAILYGAPGLEPRTVPLTDPAWTLAAREFLAATALAS